MNLKKGTHCTYSLIYHLVLVVKYRKPCIDNDIAQLIKEKTAFILKENKGSLIEANSDKNHIHLLIETSPDNNLAKLVGAIKGITSRCIRKKYQTKISHYLWGNSFWSDSYFIASAGGASIDTLKQYIENQGKSKQKNNT